MDNTRLCFQTVVLIFVSILFAMAPAVSRAAPLTLDVPGPGSGPGNDPLLDVNSWFVFQGESATATITLASGDLPAPATGQFAGRVNVVAECCFDTTAQKNVALDGLDVVLTVVKSLVAANPQAPSGPGNTKVVCRRVNGKLDCPTQSKAAQLVDLAAGGKLILRLSVVARGAVTPGRYALIVSATSVGSTEPLVANDVGPLLNVMPALDVDNGEIPPACPMPPPPASGQVTGEVGSENRAPIMEVLLLRPLIRELFAAKAQDPTRTVFFSGFMTLSQSAGWNFTIMKPPSPLPSNMTMITVTNNQGWAKIMAGYNSGVCPHTVPPIMPVPISTSVSMVVNLTTAKTLLLRRQACANWVGAICTDSNRFEDIAIFSETNFAALFGGRSVTLDWFWSYGE